MFYTDSAYNDIKRGWLDGKGDSMIAVLLKAGSLTFIIILGILLRRMQPLPDHSGQVVKKVLLYITLPMAVVVNFSSMTTFDSRLLILMPVGIIANIFMILLAMVVTRRSSPRKKALYMLCLPSVNIGAFCFPFIQNFMTAYSLIGVCLYDVGNSIMCAGLTYAFTAAYLEGSKEKNKLEMRSFFIRMLKNPPLIAYVTMCLLTLVGIRLPCGLVDFISPMASANAFMAMMMIGLLFRFDARKEQLKKHLGDSDPESDFCSSLWCCMLFSSSFLIGNPAGHSIGCFRADRSNISGLCWRMWGR